MLSHERKGGTMKLLALLVTALAVANFLAGCAAEEEASVEGADEKTVIEEEEKTDVEEADEKTGEETTSEETSETQSASIVPPATMASSGPAQGESMHPSHSEEAVRERDPAPTESGISTTQTAVPNPVTVGQPLTFTITVKNSSVPQLAGLKAFLPSGVSLVSASPGQGSCTADHHGANAVECPLGVIPGGGSVKIVIVVIPTVPGTATNIASAQGEASPATPANIASTTVTVNPGSGPVTGAAHGAH
jgi:uncharacterized repeat protein (TIGR01451 family)